MKRILHYTIDKQSHGMRIGDFLRSQGFSRHMLTLLKQDQSPLTLSRVSTEGADCKLYMPVSEGDILTVEINEAPHLEAAPPVSLPLSIVYEDEDILVVNKPPFMPVHPSQGHREDTLANAVNGYYAAQNTAIIYRCINRLDRDTSGLLIVAKHMLAAASLSMQMKERKIHRTYIAIVHGQITEAGTVDAPIARVEGSTIERCVNFDAGESAVTHFTPLSFDPVQNRTLLMLRLETGRTHQIRVHMTHIGHPLVGDFLYQRPDLYPDTSQTSDLYYEASSTLSNAAARQALHSYELSFTHPVTGKACCFRCPLPEDMSWPELCT